MSGRPIAFIESLVGQASSLADTQWQVRWDWDWPFWVTLVTVLLVATWVGTWYAREISPSGKSVRVALSLLRTSALLLVALMFAQPTLERFRLARPPLVILIDRSESMETQDVFISDAQSGVSEMSRIEAVKQLLVAGQYPLLDRLAKKYQVEVVAFDTEQTLFSSKKQGLNDLIEQIKTSVETANGTNLAGAVNYALRELPGHVPSAAVLFTDGVATQGPMLIDVLRKASGLHVPIYPVAVGSEKPRPDVGIKNLLVEELVFPGDRLQVEVTLQAKGFAGQKAIAKLYNEESQTVLAQTEVELPVDEKDTQIVLAIRPTEPGSLTLKLIVEPLGGEANVDNNVSRQVVEVSDKKVRTLLVQASPSYEYRALKSLLERDPAIDLRVLLQESGVDFTEVEEVALADFPGSELALNEYDVLILGDINPALLSRQLWPTVEKFVSKSGGGVICIAGPRFMPAAFRDVPALQKLLPLEYDTTVATEVMSTYLIEPTALGRRESSLQLGNTAAESAAIWSSLPAVQWKISGIRPKPGAQVLATSTSDGKILPMFFRHYVGAGEVLFHATDETWRWRWRTDDRYFARYWGQAVRRLGRGRLVANRHGTQLTTDRAQYDPGESVHLQVRFNNALQVSSDPERMTVEVRGASGGQHEVELRRRGLRKNVFEAELSDLISDEYEARLLPSEGDTAGQVTRFTIQQPPKEFARLAVNRQQLQMIATQSGGTMIPLAEAVERLANLPTPQPVKQEVHSPRKLWNSHLIMGLFVVVLSAEWLLRRRFGML